MYLRIHEGHYYFLDLVYLANSPGNSFSRTFAVWIVEFGIHTPSFWASQVVLVVKNLPANAGNIIDVGSIPGSGRSPGEGNGNQLQYFFLGESPGQRNLEGYSPQRRK